MAMVTFVSIKRHWSRGDEASVKPDILRVWEQLLYHDVRMCRCGTWIQHSNHQCVVPRISKKRNCDCSDLVNVSLFCFSLNTHT